MKPLEPGKSRAGKWQNDSRRLRSIATIRARMDYLTQLLTT